MCASLRAVRLQQHIGSVVASGHPGTLHRTRRRQKADQKRALVARLLVRACIHRALGLKWGQFEVKRTRGKKPFVATEHDRKGEAPNFNFNVAHEVRNSSTGHADLHSQACG